MWRTIYFGGQRSDMESNLIPRRANAQLQLQASRTAPFALRLSQSITPEQDESIDFGNAGQFQVMSWPTLG
jgi:hypothetical protein